MQVDKSTKIPKNDLTEREFGSLRVLYWLPREKRSDGSLAPLKWLCKCSCGNTKVVTTGDLVNHRVRSCGCMIKKPKKETKYNQHRVACPAPCKSCLEQWEKGKCCAECEEKETCKLACLNSPERCGRKDNLINLVSE